MKEGLGKGGGALQLLEVNFFFWHMGVNSPTSFVE